jgi:selenocysteine lyase/cysteine desulfurase
MKDLLNLPEGTARASTYLYNTLEEVELFLGAVEDIAR